MAESIVEKMFGLSPSQVETARQAELGNEAARFAKLSPFERANAGMYQSGGGLMRAGMGMLGMQDPEVALAQQSQEIQKRIDHSTPEGLMEGARIFNQAGNPKMAYMYHQAANAKQKELADINLRQAQAQKALREEDMTKYGRLQKIEVGVEGKPDYRQQALYDPLTGETRNIGAPYRIPASITAESKATAAESKESAKTQKQKDAEIKSAIFLEKKMSEVERAMSDSLGVEPDKLAALLSSGEGSAANRLESAVGVWDSMTPKWAQSQTKANILSHIERLKSLGQTGGLTELRASGVAPGSITEREWPKFQADLANIDTSLSGKELVKQYFRIYQKVLDARQKAQDLKSGQDEQSSQNDLAAAARAELARRRGGK